MMKGRRTNGKLAEFGELVHFFIPKTKDMPGKIADRWSEGIWLGCDVRSGEHLIGMTVECFVCQQFGPRLPTQGGHQTK